MSRAIESVFSCLILLMLCLAVKGQTLQGLYSRDDSYWSKECLLFSETGTFRHWITNTNNTSYGCGTYKLTHKGKELELYYTDSTMSGRAKVENSIFEKPIDSKIHILILVKDAWTGWIVSDPRMYKISELSSGGWGKIGLTDGIHLDTTVCQGKDTFLVGDPYVSLNPLILSYNWSLKCTYIIPVTTHKSMLGKHTIYDLTKLKGGIISFVEATDRSGKPFLPQKSSILHK